MVLLPEDAGVSDDVLPPGVTDINGHQLDLRTTNSWVLKMEEVSTPEIMEVGDHLVQYMCLVCCLVDTNAVFPNTVHVRQCHCSFRPERAPEASHGVPQRR